MDVGNYFLLGLLILIKTLIRSTNKTLIGILYFSEKRNFTSSIYKKK